MTMIPSTTSEKYIPKQELTDRLTDNERFDGKTQIVTMGYHKGFYASISCQFLSHHPNYWLI